MARSTSRSKTDHWEKETAQVIGLNRMHRNTPVVLAMLMGLGLAFGQMSTSTAAGAATRAQAIAAVRGILQSKSSSCRIDRVKSVAAVRSGAVWMVTTKLVMSASGQPQNETAVWNVRVSDGKAVAADQLASEIENGCP